MQHWNQTVTVCSAWVIEGSSVNVFNNLHIDNRAWKDCSKICITRKRMSTDVSEQCTTSYSAVPCRKKDIHAKMQLDLKVPLKCRAAILKKGTIWGCWKACLRGYSIGGLQQMWEAQCLMASRGAYGTHCERGSPVGPQGEKLCGWWGSPFSLAIEEFGNVSPPEFSFPRGVGSGGTLASKPRGHEFLSGTASTGWLGPVTYGE